MPIEAHLFSYLESIPLNAPVGTLYVGYSGGVDSTVLLYALSLLSKKSSDIFYKKFRGLKAIHINHQLQEDASSWQVHCLNFCKELGLECIVKVVTVDKTLSSLEESARIARYKAFESVLSPFDTLMLSHHHNDNIETLLMRICRGASPRGFQIPQLRKLSQCNGLIHRPLLGFSKKAILHYAKENKLSWVTDHSNLSNQYERNFIRNDIVPILQVYYPSFESKIKHTLTHLNESVELINELAMIDLKIVLQNNTILVDKLKMLSVVRIKNVLKFWFEMNQIHSPSPKSYETILKDFLKVSSSQSKMDNSRIDPSIINQVKIDKCLQSDDNPILILSPMTGFFSDKIKEVIHSQIQLRRFKNQLHIVLVSKPTCYEYEWDTRFPLKLENQQTYMFEEWLGNHPMGLQKGDCFMVKLRRGGEKVKPIGRYHTPLKNLLQEAQIPPWERDWVGIVYKANSPQKAIAVLNFCYCEPDC